MWYIYTMEYHPAIYSNMDGLRDYYIKCSKSERKSQKYYISLIRAIQKKGNTNKLISKTETHRHRKQNYQMIKGWGEGQISG